ncbi:MAG: hypothetical protein M3464_02550 [Chloroflexota bacterium]|nr:hypothetical protein [Chloroflexota bacterium]
MLDGVDHIRGELGREIFRLRQQANALYACESLDAVQPAIMAGHLIGQQEVSFHFFAVCVGRIERLLHLASRAAGHTFRPADQALLHPYRQLRDYYEHLDERLPGGGNYAPADHEEERDGQWYIRIGLDLDHLERLVLKGVAIDVSPRGVAAVHEVLKRNWEQLSISTLTLVRKHFERDPSNIPLPSDVKHNLLVSLGLWNEKED